MQRPVKRPGPDHTITIARSEESAVVKIGGRVVADSAETLILQEAGYPPARYFPRKHVDLTTLTRSDHRTYCPYKGDCTYFSAPGSPNAAWSYETPFPAVAEIKDCLAFYPDRIDPDS